MEKLGAVQFGVLGFVNLNLLFLCTEGQIFDRTHTMITGPDGKASADDHVWYNDADDEHPIGHVPSTSHRSPSPAAHNRTRQLSGVAKKPPPKTSAKSSNLVQTTLQVGGHPAATIVAGSRRGERKRKKPPRPDDDNTIAAKKAKVSPPDEEEDPTSKFMLLVHPDTDTGHFKVNPSSPVRSNKATTVEDASDDDDDDLEEARLDPEADDVDEEVEEMPGDEDGEDSDGEDALNGDYSVCGFFVARELLLTIECRNAHIEFG